ncbi:hypothetical protein DSL72_004430 [Monilinia vaccinii-corymbosi]|uniref:Uncharacterized protein n=1 Tax=Monilinia vaccinii-corymbosi TaxID=61207 RepID=A0A8A3NZ91_9HELO|nr:hypothetical protein DSL72_004430 [Monilinia vaccinii-corymbosi]
MRRNLINARGFTCPASGAMEATVVFTTFQIQDSYDQAGDSACGRSTMPLALRDWQCRFIAALAISIWLWAFPADWKGSASVAAPFARMGFIIVVRLILKRIVAHDKTTFKLLNSWVPFSLYTPVS